MKGRLIPLFDAHRRAYVLPVENLPKITHSAAEWRKRLTPDQFRIMRDRHHQKPFEVPPKFVKPAVGSFFSCAGCDLPLYHASHQVHGRSQGWLVFGNCIQRCVRFIQDGYQTPQGNEEQKTNTTQSGPLRRNYFEPLNASRSTSLSLRCNLIENTPFEIPSMGKHTSISKDGRQVSFGLVCSCCHCFVGTFFSVKAREDNSQIVLGSQSLSTGKHIVFPMSVKLCHMEETVTQNE
ncbi:peptide methionine sulfoxide reductase msrB [Perkinsela sp. CCAP 1560/4]|nr:peptide methionine sulfoxide reductase msrB [Perkinsela sp. CCAP 1560/4]|eukprot:KNH04443.1 peptide methionine sulfoxide reductase msrB [Perkinsela sp. CCAP 1560/4]